MQRDSWVIRRVPQWLRNALNTQRTDMPQVLVTASDERGGDPFATVQATLDAFQGGVGIAEPVTLITSHTGAIAANTPVVLLQGAPDVSYLLLGLNVVTVNIAAARRLWIGLLPIVQIPGAANGTGVVLFDPTLPIPTNPLDAVISWKTINGEGDGRLYIPPGFSLAWSAPDLAGGETASIVLTALRIPAGFKPF